MSDSKYKCDNYKNIPGHYCPACFHNLKKKYGKVLEFAIHATQAYDDVKGYLLLREIGELVNAGCESR